MLRGNANTRMGRCRPCFTLERAPSRAIRLRRVCVEFFPRAAWLRARAHPRNFADPVRRAAGRPDIASARCRRAFASKRLSPAYKDRAAAVARCVRSSGCQPYKRAGPPWRPSHDGGGGTRAGPPRRGLGMQWSGESMEGEGFRVFFRPKSRQPRPTGPRTDPATIASSSDVRLVNVFSGARRHLGVSMKIHELGQMGQRWLAHRDKRQLSLPRTGSHVRGPVATARMTLHTAVEA